MVLTGHENITDASFEELDQMLDMLTQLHRRDGLSDFWKARFVQIRREMTARIYGPRKS